MIRRPPRSTQSRSSAASDVYKRQAVRTVRVDATLPVDRLGWVEVGGVEEAGLDADDPSERPFAGGTRYPVRAGVERELGRAADQQVGMLCDGLVDAVVRGLVDAKRLLSQEMLLRCQNVAVDLFVKVVGHSAVDGVDVGAFEHLAVVGVAAFDSRHMFLEPAASLFVGIADGPDHRPHAEVLK